ncbi:MAG: hypothetical protein ACRD0D_10520, partial [Acidimicrobiales bacterium]
MATIPAPARRRRPVALVAVWTGVLIVALGAAMYGLGPLLYDREQRSLLVGYRTAIERAVDEQSSPFGSPPPVRAPVAGAPVGVIE